ncbi:MAG: ABC transporter permease [Clostridiales bacterium]|nr:ABC transporter permease [Clostridiales bacterium]
MQVFKAFFIVAKKHLAAAFIYFIIYSIMTIVLSGVGSDTYADYFQTSSLNICITDEDHSKASAALIAYLRSLHNIEEVPKNDEIIFDRMYARFLDYALIIPEGFEENLLSGSTDGLLSSQNIPDGTAGFYVSQQISQYLTSLRLYLAGGVPLAEAVEKTDATLASVPEVKMLSFEASKDSTKGVFYFFQYMPYIYIAILFTGLAPILVTLNSSRIRARTACSALSTSSHNRQLALGCILYSSGIWLLFSLLGVVLYQEAIFETYALLSLLNSFVSLLFTTAATLLVSLFSPNNDVLNMLSNIIGLSMSFLCGVFVPQSMLAPSVLAVGRFLPAYWYIRANNMLAGFGKEVFDREFYLLCIGIQLLFAAVMFSITFVVARQRRK